MVSYGDMEQSFLFSRDIPGLLVECECCQKNRHFSFLEDLKLFIFLNII